MIVKFDKMALESISVISCDHERAIGSQGQQSQWSIRTKVKKRSWESNKGDSKATLSKTWL